MKKLCSAVIVVLAVCTMLQGCGTKDATVERSSQPTAVVENSQPSEVADANSSASGITEDMAYEGVSNYCHSEFDWSVAEENPDMMYVTMGEPTESEYKVIFRSYTGSFIYFYVDKVTGTTRMTEYVPALDIENDTGTIQLFDYLEKQS